MGTEDGFYPKYVYNRHGPNEDVHPEGIYSLKHD